MGHSAIESVISYQDRALTDVSRTFALTIPQLPSQVRYVIGNAYLLCRIADTIEDEPSLDIQHKRQFLARFSDVVRRKASVHSFATELTPMLSIETPEAERELVSKSPLVVGFNQDLPPGMRKPVEKCLETMCHGMAEFVDTGPDGLPSIKHVERYCYYVAGAVGEMITDVFCDYSTDIASKHEEMFSLSSKFGRGLQLVNILKDHNEDLVRGVSWLPHKSLYRKNKANSRRHHDRDVTKTRIVDLIRRAKECLDAALRYILLIPSSERGIRKFLVWTVGLAALTLRRMMLNPLFRKAEEIKVSRRQLSAMITATNYSVRSNQLIQWLYNLATPAVPTVSK